MLFGDWWQILRHVRNELLNTHQITMMDIYLNLWEILDEVLKVTHFCTFYCVSLIWDIEVFPSKNYTW